MNNSAAHTALVNDVLIEISPLGLAYKNNTGAIKTEDRFIRYGLQGSSDIIACIKSRFVGIECKTGTGRVKKNQGDFATALTSAGGLYIVARSVDDVTSALKLEGLA